MLPRDQEEPEDRRPVVAVRATGQHVPASMRPDQPADNPERRRHDTPGAEPLLQLERRRDEEQAKADVAEPVRHPEPIGHPQCEAPHGDDQQADRVLGLAG